MRRTSDKRIPVPQSAHNSASKLPPKNTSEVSSSGSNKILKAHVPVLTGRHHQQQYLHQNSFSSPPPHAKSTSEAYYSSGNENKGGSGVNVSNSGEGISGGIGNSGSVASAGSGSTLLQRKASKGTVEVTPVAADSHHTVIRSEGDDDDLEVVEIDLRH